MKHCFIVTSAINTRFGIYAADKRLSQTLNTVSSIRSRVADAKIVLIEMAGVPLTSHQEKTLVSEVDMLLDFSNDNWVSEIYQSTDNWDIVKNSTEITATKLALELLLADQDLAGIDRVHKISGRYVLNDNFKLTDYSDPAVQSKIVISKRRPSAFPPHFTDQKFEYMSRLWSWPTELTPVVISTYEKSITNFVNTTASGGYIDIEHSLGKFLPPQHVHEVDVIGVQGNIGPNGVAVAD